MHAKIIGFGVLITRRRFTRMSGCQKSIQPVVTLQLKQHKSTYFALFLSVDSSMFRSHLGAPLLLALLSGFLACGVQAISKITRTGRYLYTDSGSRFYIKGISYQEQGWQLLQSQLTILLKVSRRSRCTVS